MNIAIVILNWNGAALLKEYLPNVINYSKEARIYVIDNASTDNSVALIETDFPTVNCIVNKENFGFAGGYNQGLKHIDADLYCLLNSDVAVSKGWLSPIIETFLNKPQIAIAQPKILDLKQPEYFEYAGAGGGFIDAFGYPFCRGRIFQTIEKDQGQYDDSIEIFWATGACMFIRKNVFNALKGFDEDYFAHQEEIDLCWRAKNIGHKIYYIGASHVFHLGGFTLKNSNPHKTFLNFRNSLYSITKNLPTNKAIGIVFIRLILDGIAAARFLLQLRGLHAWAILRAHFSFYANFHKMYKKREKANFILKYHFVKSIVWSYFVYQIRYFNNLVKD
ncbi:dTDP-Rha--alpha-D-GlcNAc-pyrophosphate polyprenol alpha-3-L-rhamnosyltransferase [Croceivirga radicis]|uniref:dTDP-Rha--alpha-D-GlcNAc-pyrophosphate polyprenol alpha-3-L-rhamnosyltransferase n=1 Tax=Croceivirga radicis TaxID=1929488 RepID=A0A1V6LT08_9FLAO|nr:glycosyltransferase family 2 protein [Croceivirga radicis]OQD43278.1 dTDP-Rha--alpha-D-GlcNAc-pyrophosphate polyprenol alpha-3-L-rhamnosyltransferase [Croceivirga radicis]